MDQFDFYPQKPELIERESRGTLASTVFSMVLFVMVFLFVFSESVNFVLMILLVLLVHELGHFGFMKLYKYQNVRMLFIPLMGAFVNGSKSSYSQKESFLVVLAGPLPGIIIGSVCILLSPVFVMPELLKLGLIFLVLNIVNLIPLDPLDGGQLFKLLVQRKNEFFLMVFSFISSLVLIIGGWFMDAYLIIIFGFLMGFRVRALQKRYQMHKDLNEEEVNYNTTYKLLSNKDFSKIKETVLQHTPALAKYMEVADSDELDQIMASQVNSVLVTPTKQDASIFFKMMVVFSWLIAIASPFILYYFTDKAWVEYALSNW